MKVFEINSVAGIRSTGRIADDIAGILQKEGHTVRIAYGREQAPARCAAYSVKLGTDLGAKLRFARGLVFDDQGKGAKGATRKLIREIRDFAPDIVHLHNVHGYYLNIDLLFRFLADAAIPVVWTLHDCWAFTGHCAYFDYAKCNRWKEEGGCQSCPEKGVYPPSLLKDNSKKNFAEKRALFTALPNVTLVTPSRWLAALAKESFLGKYEVVTIPNGIDATAFRPTESDIKSRLGIGEKRLLLGIASVWDRRKGLPDFIRLRERLDDSWHILLVGLTKKQISSLPAGITGLTRTDSVKELASLYTAADVVANPTYEDNFPTVNLEAEACGTPVVTYLTGGSPEGLTLPSSTAVPKGDIEALTQAILTAEKPNSVPPTRFDRTQTVLPYLSLYERILSAQK